MNNGSYIHLRENKPMTQDTLMTIEPTPTRKDSINPGHYKKKKIETVDAMEAFFTDGKPCDMHCSQSFKYTARAGDKKEGDETLNESYLRDLKKAHWWLTRAIHYMETVCHTK